MKLTSEQIKSVLFGAVQTVETPEGITGHKCSPETLAQWKELFPNVAKNALPPTGLRLDFETDATSVRFTVRGKFECLVDGLLTASSDPKEDPSLLSLAFGAAKPRRITLIFPSHDSSEGILSGVELNDGAAVAPHKYDEKFLFLGDSITQGWNSGIDSLSYAWRTSLFFNADCIIYGVGGGVFHPAVFEAPSGFDPDRVFVAFGTNDFGHYKTLADLRLHASQYLDLVTGAYEGKKIYGITPIWRYDPWEKTMGSFDECIAVLREEYEKRGIFVIDGLKLVPHDKAFFADALHPNALGFSLYAQNLIRILLS